MKVVLCHNFYQQAGGEDLSFAQEARLLESKGHEVIRFTRHNDSIKQMGAINAAVKTIWSTEAYRDLRKLLRSEKPDLIHCTNTFPLISPSAYYAARKEGIAVVQSLRNYRMFCAGAYFMRDGKICESCLGKRFALPAIVNKCYRGSRAGSTVLASMIAIHRSIGTWSKAVDRYFALTNFSREKFIEGGLPANKIDIKPNFLFDDPGPGNGSGGYAIFVGRLSDEKGVALLLNVWPQLQSPPLLKVVGEGPLQDMVKDASKAEPSKVQWCGQLDQSEVLRLVGDATCLIQPSLWYEGFPRTILESFAKGTPVIASKLGSMEEIVEEGACGHLFEPNEVALRETIEKFLSSATQHPEMRLNARRRFLDRYSASTNYEILMSIYSRAIESASQRRTK